MVGEVDSDGRKRVVHRPLVSEQLEQHESAQTGLCVRMAGPLIAVVPYGETS